MIQAALQEDALEPVVAQRLTGKLNFLSTTLFGHGGARSFALRMGPFRPTCWDCSHPGAPSFTAWRFSDKLSLQ